MLMIDEENPLIQAVCSIGGPTLDSSPPPILTGSMISRPLIIPPPCCRRRRRRGKASHTCTYDVRREVPELSVSTLLLLLLLLLLLCIKE